MKTKPLTENARKVLEARYLKRDKSGRVAETPEKLFVRVARAISGVEKKNKSKWCARFFDLMSSLRFLPNTPTLLNAGKKEGQLSACFVLPIGDAASIDSSDGIFNTLKNAAKIHQSGGGTGFSFSALSQPIEAMQLYDRATEVIKQGGVRRGANMAVLGVDHPEILRFINCKRDLKAITNFNISVSATDLFMKEVMSGKKEAKKIFDQTAEAAWECGDPGMIFIDRINEFNPTPQIGKMESTNPCGEQPLLPYESCNLGSLNLEKYVLGQDLDWSLLREDVWSAVRFLDNVITANVFPIPESGEITLRNRKIGLGVMGFADALLRRDIFYDSEEACSFGEKVMGFIEKEGLEASTELACEKGAFSAWKGSRWQKLGYPKLRNATVTTVAPTGTISIIAGCSSGIEPIFSEVFYKNVLSGARLVEKHPDASTAAWCPAWKVSIEGHVRMQAVFQKYSHSAVSKTVNLPAGATVEDVKKAYLLAYELGCKGITVYRDQSRKTQVLESVDLCVDC